MFSVTAGYPLCCKPDDKYGNYKCTTGSFDGNAAGRYWNPIQDGPNSYLLGGPNAASDWTLNSPPYPNFRGVSTDQFEGPKDLYLMPSMWPYCPFKPGCGCDDPQPGKGVLVANWTRPSSAADSALPLREITNKDITSIKVRKSPSRSQDPYLVNYLLAVSRDITTTVNLQPTTYAPDGPSEVCPEMLPPYFNETTNESFPNPNYPACQPCNFFGSFVPNCTQKEPKMYPWPFYPGLQGMVK